MTKYTLFTRHKKLFLVLGIIEGCSILIMLISLLLLPVASYNLTKLDVTKISFNFFDLIETNPSVSIGFFLLCVSMVPIAMNKMLIQKDTWRDKIKIMMLFTFVGVVVFTIGAVVFDLSIIEYTDPKTNDTFVFEKEIGAYLFWSGLLSIAVAVYEVISLKLILDGKYTEDQLFGSQIIKKETVIDKNIDEKLSELIRLKEDGIITEDEYSQKKKELLDLYK